MIETYNNLFSICIPTYNRDAKLFESISRLIPIVSKYNFPIFISDNCSTDDTFSTYLSLKNTYKYLYYSKNLSNMGFDFNFEKVLKMSTTKYRWLLGDDDYYNSGEFDEILELIEINAPDMILLNYNSKKNLEKDEFFNDSNFLLSKMCAHMTFLSCVIYNEKIINSANFSKYYKTQFLHVGIAFDYLATIKDPEVYFLSKHSVKPLPDRKIDWSDKVFRYFTIGLNLMLDNLPEFYTAKSKRHAARSVLKYKFNKIMFPIESRVFGDLNIKTLISNFSYINRSYIIPVLFYMIILCLIPKSLCSYLYWTLKGSKKIVINLINKV